MYAANISVDIMEMEIMPDHVHILMEADTQFGIHKAVDSIALQQSLRDLDGGYVNFFQKRAAHPTFKSKHKNHLHRGFKSEK